MRPQQGRFCTQALTLSYKQSEANEELITTNCANSLFHVCRGNSGGRERCGLLNRGGEKRDDQGTTYYYGVGTHQCQIIPNDSPLSELPRHITLFPKADGERKTVAKNGKITKHQKNEDSLCLQANYLLLCRLWSLQIAFTHCYLNIYEEEEKVLRKSWSSSWYNTSQSFYFDVLWFVITLWSFIQLTWFQRIWKVGKNNSLLSDAEKSRSKSGAFTVEIILWNCVRLNTLLRSTKTNGFWHGEKQQ